jgi:ubiquinone/menaquinone biosynthesis C-methylase UbiE
MGALTEHRKDQIEMHREVAAMYKRRAAYPFAEEFQQERNDLLLAMAQGGVECRAVDLGCGTGLLLPKLASRFRRVAGLDISHEMLTGFDPASVPPGTSIALARADMAALPLAPSSFDVVFCRSALHHMDDEIAVLSEICRVLKPDGRLVLGEPANDFPLFRLARWFVKRRPSFGKIHTIDRAYTRGQMRELLRRSGLEVDRERRFGFVGYVFCDNPDLVPVLKHLPPRLALSLSRFLRGLDRVLARVPVVKNWSWYTILSVRRAAPS